MARVMACLLQDYTLDLALSGANCFYAYGAAFDFVKSFDMMVETSIEFQPTTFQQMAGLIAYYDTENHYYLRISHDDDLGRTLNIIATDAGHSCEILPNDVPIPPTGPVNLRLTLNGADLQFEFSVPNGRWHSIGPVLNGAILSDDYNHLGFTGAFVGLCCQDISGQRLPADFERFVYRLNPA